MVLATLLLAVLFIAGLINIFRYKPINKICSWLQNFSPIKSKTSITNIASTSSSPRRSDSYKNKQELRKVFSTFDKNGDGFITRRELGESLRNIRIFMTDKEIDEIVAKFDSNGDGLLEFDEFCLLVSGIAGDDEKQGKAGEEEEKEEVNLKEAFDVFDKDQDGLITVEELALVLNSLGLREGKKIEECKEMIKKVDLDGDGMVNFNEFKKMMINAGKLLFAT